MSASGRALAMSFAALCVQGTWATWANADAGKWIAVKAGVVQGLCSFVMTYLVTMFMEFVLLRVSFSPAWIRGIVVGISGILFMLTIQVGAHALAGTPHILLTIAPAAAVGTCYCMLYSQRQVHVMSSDKSAISSNI